MTGVNDTREQRIADSKGREISQGVNRDGNQDPRGEFPSPQYWNSPNTNYAATGNATNELYVGGGDKEVDLGLADKKASQYPYNQVSETISGHVIEVDDTPGGERILIKHRTGAGVELRQDGTVLVASTKNKIEVTGDDHNVIVEGDGNMVYKGNLNIQVTGEFNVECTDFNIKTNGNMNTNVVGSQRTTVGETKSDTVRGGLSQTVTQQVTNTYLGGLSTNVKGTLSHNVEGPANYVSSENTIMTSETKLNMSSPDVNLAAENLSVFGDQGTIGGENIIMYNYNMHTGHSIYSETVTTNLVYGDLKGTAEKAITSDVTNSQNYADPDPGGGTGSAAGYTIDETKEDTKATALPTGALLDGYLNRGDGGVRKIKIDEGDWIKNQIDKTVAYDGISSTPVSPTVARSKLRDPSNQNNKTFVSQATAEGNISPNWNRPTPVGIGRTVSGGSTPKFGQQIFGNARASDGANLFLPRSLNVQLVPDPRFNPNFKNEITAKTKLSEGVSISKFMGSKGDPTNLSFIRDLEQRKQLARNLYAHAEYVMKSVSTNKGDFKDLRLIVAEGVYRPGPSEKITPGSINDLKLKGQAIVYELVDNKGKIDAAKTFDLAEYWKDAIYFDKLILDYDEIDPNEDLNAQIIVVMPEITDDFSATFNRKVETFYNGKKLADAELVEALTYPVTSVQSTINIPLDSGGRYGINLSTRFKPIIDTLNGTSPNLRPGALENMKSMLENEYTKMQEYYGGRLYINDALAKAGTSRTASTPASQHFFGRALDIDISGMTDYQKIKLANSAMKAGFRGFGFGSTILHVDLGSSRGWGYNNRMWAGKPVGELIRDNKGNVIDITSYWNRWARRLSPEFV